MSDAAVSGQSHYRHVKPGQEAAERLVETAGHNVREWILRARRHPGASDNDLNILAYPQNAEVRTALETLERKRIDAYRTLHLKAREAGADTNTLDAEARKLVADLKTVGVEGAPEWYVSGSNQAISTERGYAGGTYAVDRPGADSDWSLVLVVTNPTVEGLTTEAIGRVWLDHVTHHTDWAVRDRMTATSVVLTVTGWGHQGDKKVFDLIARNNIAPSRLTLTVTVT